MIDASPQLSWQYLQNHFHDGWWPYLPGREPSNEATAWCAIACRKTPEIAIKSLRYLVSAQNRDGGWSTQAGTQPSDWTSGLVLTAVQVLRYAGLNSQYNADPILEKSAQSIRDGAIYLLRSRVDLITAATRIAMFLINGVDFDYPRGWPWSPDTFNWVEPTANAVVAIKMTPQIAQKRYALAIKEAHDYFMDKQCQTGGWNYGAVKAVGAYLPSQPVPTAWALLAMYGSKKTARLEKAIAYLQNDDGDPAKQTLQAQALTILALDAHHINVQERARQLQEQFSQHEPAANNLFIMGLSTTAAQVLTHGNPFTTGSLTDARS